VAFQHSSWLDHQRAKILRGLDALESAPPDPTRVTAGTITIGCMLTYLDRRKPVDWRVCHPALVAWLDAFLGATPAFNKILT
jgi:glutathione S-transferase